jgi:hypothetical protein
METRAGAVVTVWPKTGFFSNRRPARKKSTVRRRMVVGDVVMLDSLKLLSVCRARCVAGSGLRH